MMKRLLPIFIFSQLLMSCNGYDTEQLEELSPLNSSSEIDQEGPQDPVREPDTEEPIREPDAEAPPIEEPFRCIKSIHHNPNFIDLKDLQLKACKKATRSQIATVNKGNAKKDDFLKKCYAETGNSCWCDQLTRPNPSSINTFRCTYGSSQPHQLIHPTESTWKFAIEAAKIVVELEKKGIGVTIIYNWWRPEPYNKNVGGSATRHPFGTSIDVRFVTKAAQEKAFIELCKMRKRGRVKAVGYYSSSALHFGVGDHNGNTWGKSCP